MSDAAHLLGLDQSDRITSRVLDSQWLSTHHGVCPTGRRCTLSCFRCSISTYLTGQAPQYLVRQHSTNFSKNRDNPQGVYKQLNQASLTLCGTQPLRIVPMKLIRRIRPTARGTKFFPDIIDRSMTEGLCVPTCNHTYLPSFNTRRILASWAPFD
jgi:hypothetical protein